MLSQKCSARSLESLCIHCAHTHGARKHEPTMPAHIPTYTRAGQTAMQTDGTRGVSGSKDEWYLCNQTLQCSPCARPTAKHTHRAWLNEDPPHAAKDSAPTALASATNANAPKTQSSHKAPRCNR